MKNLRLTARGLALAARVFAPCGACIGVFAPCGACMGVLAPCGAWMVYGGICTFGAWIGMRMGIFTIFVFGLKILEYGICVSF